MYNSALCEECHSRLITEEEEAEARTMSCDEILVEGIDALIQIAYDNGLDDDRVDAVLMDVINQRAKEVRSGFKVH